MLRLKIQKHPQVVVLRCSGRIVKGDGAEILLRTIMSEDSRYILIDLTDVSTIDAAGVGAFAKLECWARDSSRRLYLVNPSKAVREVLEITGLSLVLQIFSATPQKARSRAA